jgi:lysozyme C
MMRYIALVAVLLMVGAEAKTFSRCELAQELVFRQGFPQAQAGDWVCLCEAESSRNTAAKGGPNSNGSYDYGLFQINDYYWCAQTGAVDYNDCNVNCNDLLDNNITDDSKCAHLVYNRHGFTAWYGWINKCEGKDVSSYVAGCF